LYYKIAGDATIYDIELHFSKSAEPGIKSMRLNIGVNYLLGNKTRNRIPERVYRMSRITRIERFRDYISALVMIPVSPA